MKPVTRRELLKVATTGAMAFGAPSLALLGPRLSKGAGLNAELRLGVIGLGGIDIVGGVGGRGRQLIANFRAVPGVRIAALCDVDQAILDHEVQQFTGRGEKVAACTDLRRLLDDKTIDAVAIATPNHWHALATIWACQAGKDVYIEKPFSYNIWEGRQMVAAARKYARMVQVGTQRRSSKGFPQVIEYVRGGAIGPMRCVYALVYRAREGIGKVTAPTPVPPTVDYNLWCGPAPVQPLMRKQLHYDWHWFWSTGNGEIANNGAHHIDIARWALGQDKPAPRAMSIGGRFGFRDDAETANTQIAYFDYRPAPLICEVRNVRASKDAGAIGKFRGIGAGVIIDCEGGYVVNDASGGTVFDPRGKRIKDMPDSQKAKQQEVLHATNFVEAVRSRNSGSLHAEALVGHVTAACCHAANLSHRLGHETPPEAILEATRAKTELSDAFERCRDYLRENGVDLRATPAVLGPWLTFDADREQFVGDFADRANELSRRPYREPFVVPEIT